MATRKPKGSNVTPPKSAAPADAGGDSVLLTTPLADLTLQDLIDVGLLDERSKGPPVVVVAGMDQGQRAALKAGAKKKATKAASKKVGTMKTKTKPKP